MQLHGLAAFTHAHSLLIFVDQKQRALHSVYLHLSDVPWLASS